MKNLKQILTTLVVALFMLNSFSGVAQTSFNDINRFEKNNGVTINYKNIDYVSMGKEHNTYMTQVFKEYKLTGKKGKELQMDLEFEIDRELQSSHYDELHSLSQDKKYNLILSNMKDESAKETLNDLKGILYNSANYHELVRDFDLIKNKVKRNYSGLDYGILMSYIEIGKKSAYLWFPVKLGGSGLGKDYLKNTTYTNSCRTATENDVLGGALGMVGWAITGGAVFGPFGALGGMVAATVYGAVTGSIF